MEEDLIFTSPADLLSEIEDIDIAPSADSDDAWVAADEEEDSAEEVRRAPRRRRRRSARGRQVDEPRREPGAAPREFERPDIAREPPAREPAHHPPVNELGDEWDSDDDPAERAAGGTLEAGEDVVETDQPRRSGARRGRRGGRRGPRPAGREQSEPRSAERSRGRSGRDAERTADERAAGPRPPARERDEPAPTREHRPRRDELLEVTPHEYDIDDELEADDDAWAASVADLGPDDDDVDDGLSDRELNTETRAHKAVPSWQDAIDVIVNGNLSRRSSRPHHGGNRNRGRRRPPRDRS